jgi:uncharacterized protein (TIGR00251 family)
MGRIIRVRVTPKSARPGVAGYRHGILEVRVSSPPVRGEANRELVRVLSDHFEIAKSGVKILSGERSRLKTVLIEA